MSSCTFSASCLIGQPVTLCFHPSRTAHLPIDISEYESNSYSGTTHRIVLKFGTQLIGKWCFEAFWTILFGFHGADIRRFLLYESRLMRSRLLRPSIPVNIQNSIMACVVDMVEGVSEYHLTREAHSRKRKRAQKGSNDRTAKRHQSERPITQMNNDDGQAATAPKTHASDCGTVEEMHGDVSSNAVEPSILQHLTIGINEVTKLLERTAQSFRQTITVGSSVAPQTRTEHRSHMILVCRGDVDPPLLIQHLPHLVAACNSRRASGSENVTWLIPLSKGSESSLASALGLRRVSVVAVDGNAPRFAMLSALLENVPVLKASWLSSPTGQVETLVPTHIKQLHTTAPRDMKSAKERRAGGRAAAKERRKARAKLNAVVTPTSS